MLYKRSSYLKWLTDHHQCEIIPVRDTRVIIIKNWQITVKMWLDFNDRIDYEEIWIVNNKLMIVGMPGEKDLKRIEF